MTSDTENSPSAERDATEALPYVVVIDRWHRTYCGELADRQESTVTMRSVRRIVNRSRPVFDLALYGVGAALSEPLPRADFGGIADVLYCTDAAANLLRSAAPLEDSPGAVGGEAEKILDSVPFLFVDLRVGV